MVGWWDGEMGDSGMVRWRTGGMVKDGEMVRMEDSGMVGHGGMVGQWDGGMALFPSFHRPVWPMDNEKTWRGE